MVPHVCFNNIPRRGWEGRVTGTVMCKTPTLPSSLEDFRKDYPCILSSTPFPARRDRNNGFFNNHHHRWDSQISTLGLCFSRTAAQKLTRTTCLPQIWVAKGVLAEGLPHSSQTPYDLWRQIISTHPKQLSFLSCNEGAYQAGRLISFTDYLYSLWNAQALNLSNKVEDQLQWTYHAQHRKTPHWVLAPWDPSSASFSSYETRHLNHYLVVERQS